MKKTLMMYQSGYTTIISNIQKFLGKSPWLDYLFRHYHTINSNYNPLAANSFIKIPKELNHPRKGLINIQNIEDNECFKWRSARYLHQWPIGRT